MKVLSLFDGISCARVALENSKHIVERYYASEIDKYAIQVSENHFRYIIHIGDIRNVGKKNVIIYHDIEKGDIDLLIGGSPCQGFSFAGKQLNFEDPRSKLFFEFVRLRRERVHANIFSWKM